VEAVVSYTNTKGHILFTLRLIWSEIFVTDLL
jgi:hypothetical protein